MNCQPISVRSLRTFYPAAIFFLATLSWLAVGQANVQSIDRIDFGKITATEHCGSCDIH